MLKKFFRSLLALTFISAVLLLAQGCSKSSSPTSPSPPPPANSVSIVDFAFNPTSLTVDSGVTVTWKNNGAVQHTVTSDSGLFDSGQLSSGATYQHAFNKKGTFGYHCINHPTQMIASVIVK
ncbi:MAG: plastocyanin/azurin family copper-binding protein [candidate division Zixibacteria bacterium]|nr:plastocyanin/azurin family copper-binding protein [candidate division Zixibacteria bacterium]